MMRMKDVVDCCTSTVGDRGVLWLRMVLVVLVGTVHLHAMASQERQCHVIIYGALGNGIKVAANNNGLCLDIFFSTKSCHIVLELGGLFQLDRLGAMVPVQMCAPNNNRVRAALSL